MNKVIKNMTGTLKRFFNDFSYAMEQYTDFCCKAYSRDNKNVYSERNNK